MGLRDVIRRNCELEIGEKICGGEGTGGCSLEEERGDLGIVHDLGFVVLDRTFHLEHADGY